MTMKSQATMLVSRWASQVYGDFAPTPYALRCWIEKGWIQPPPRKVRGKWFVVPTAEYRESTQQLALSD